jgi:hypothetical protein
LIEYDLVYESLKSTRGQIVADFIVEHQVSMEHDLDIGLILLTPGNYILMDRLVMMVKG